MCDGAILRAPLQNPTTIQAFSWGYRKGYAIRFAPDEHPLHGGLPVGEGGSSDDLCVPDAVNPPSLCTPASLAAILTEDVPIRDVLALRGHGRASSRLADRVAVPIRGRTA